MENQRLHFVHSTIKGMDEDAIYDLYLQDMSLEEEDMRLQFKHLRITV
jgi:hypothetical protein